MSANNFKLTLDTIAPNASITSPTSTVDTNTAITASYSIDGASYMMTWVDSVASPSAAPSTAVWKVAATSETHSFSADGQYYIHAIFMDDVGNASAIKSSAIINYDTVNPTIEAAYAYDIDSHSHTHVNNDTFGIYIKAKDVGTVAAFDHVVISCPDLMNSPITVQAASFSSDVYTSEDMKFKAGTTDGTKTFTITAYDKAGNHSSETVTIIYDTTNPSATFELKATKTDTDPLIQYLNASNNSFVTTINTTDTDIAQYALYGDITGHTTETWTAWPASSSSVTVESLSFTTSDGTKTVNVKVKDKAGNITVLTPQTRVYDATKPVVTISTANDWIANGSGSRNDTTISYTATDATSGLNGSSPSFTCNGSTITGVSGGSFTFSKTTAGAKVGANTIVISATDNAGNTNTASVVVNIEDTFAIDSLALSGHSADGVQGFYNATTKTNIAVTVNNATAPASGRSALYVWTNTTANDTAVPSGASSVTWNSATQAVASSSIVKNTAESSSNYLHVKAVSNVGNVAYKHIQFTVDETNPTFNVSAPAAVNTRNIAVVVSNFADNLSTAYKYKLEAGDGTTLASGAFDWTTPPSSQTLTPTLASTVNSGTYSVIITLKDKAGNKTIKTVTWEYDSVAPNGTLVLKENDGTTTKANPTAIKTFKGQITYTPDSTDTYSNIQYKIWGNYSLTDGGDAKSSESDVEWVAMTAATVTTGTLYFTNNATTSTDGEDKTINIRFKDNAGNESAVISQTVRYNPNAATLVISNISHDRISCTHQLRKTGSNPVSDVDGDYADLMSFTVTTDQGIVEWKVAAYKNNAYPAADTSGSTVTAIAKQTGSQSQTGYSSTTPVAKNASWSVTVDGKDYRAALGGSASTNVDGIHYIVVFAKNEAGTWSTAGTPAA